MNEPMPSVETVSPTTIGILMSLALAAAICIASFRKLLILSGKFSYAFILAFVLFALIFAGLETFINTRRYVFDGLSHRIIVEDRWFVFLRHRTGDYSFDDVQRIEIHTNEWSYITVVLKSGKKLNTQTGSNRRIVELCKKLALLTGKQQSQLGVWE
jgi:hypothetical protein